ncbi:MAG: 5'/3'-nucleotidase SurE [Pseudomonadota bacterium]
MRILITNDDGISAPGIAVLERIAKTLADDADVWVVAPEADKSGVSHALSMVDPIRVRKIDDRHFGMTGTPTDCVIMAVRKLMPEAPDLILSGVNSGHNIAQYVTYSGTVAGALEGTIMGIRSIAVSQHYNYEQSVRNVPWEVVEEHGPALIAKLIKADMPPDTLLNVNFPSCSSNQVKGVRVTEQGRIDHSLTMTEHIDGRSKPYYWLSFFRGEERENERSDIQALHDGFISVTPLKLDITAHELSTQLRDLLSK